MLISTKGRYALRAVIDLAEHQAEGRTPLKDVAQRQDISDKYLESIFKMLVKAKIVAGVRGKGGGYRLNADPDSLDVYTVLDAVEDSLSPVEGLDEEDEALSQVSQCNMRELWRELDARIRECLQGTTVADLMDASDPADYYVI